MKTILASLLLLTATAAADKNYMKGKGETWDCGKDPVVNIMGSSATYKLTGACKAIHVNGNKNVVTVDAVDDVAVNGNENKVTVGTVDQISVNGNSNEITWKKGKSGDPNVAALGNKNNVSKAN